jgi:lysozyme
VGYGRNLEDVGITQDEAEFLLQNDLQRIVKQLQHFPWYAPLSMRRKHALIDMAYNLGIGGLMNFRNMIACLERGEYSAAALHALDSKWAGQVGPRAERIAEMLRDG